MTDETFKAEVDAFVDEVWEDVVDDIRSLVRIESVEDLDAAEPGKPWGPAAFEALEQGLAIAQRLGLDAHNCEGYLGYADLPGVSDRQIATIAHTDIVPLGEGWTVDPLDVTRRDGYLLGRGVLDDKGPFVLSLYAAKFFADQVTRTGQRLPYTIRCIVGNNEETRMGDVDWYLAHYEAPAFCFSPDADFPLICGEKGILHGSLTSAPLAGRTIIELQGGTVANAIPGKASAVVRAELSDLPEQEGIELQDSYNGTVTIIAQGKGGHASLPEGTVNAIGVLSSYLLDNLALYDDEVTQLSMMERICTQHDGAPLGIASVDDKFGPLTCIGGTITTTDDGRFVQTTDTRFPTSITSAEVIEGLNKVAEDHGATFELL
ncbi:MAG: Sapep family Mn(2+)-dependent dipeptidase, partial [Atopobiaceae bacterium]|nr:Sapep family Mn(2+)-dependent dipeptidase [Atopobiaceae bacterium]